MGYSMWVMAKARLIWLFQADTDILEIFWPIPITNEILSLFFNYFDSCVVSKLMANRQVPKFSLNNCAQNPKKTFMCPKFRTNPVSMYTKRHISTNLLSFRKLCLLYCEKYLPLLQQIADLLKKIRLVGTLLDTKSFTNNPTRKKDYCKHKS